jgi:hypothetical protein
MIRRNLHLLAVAAILIVAVTPALAAKGGNGNGPSGTASTGSCTVVAGNLVAATGLPTDEVINLMVTDASGTSGWVLGYTADGTITAAVPTPSGATSYSFVSRTWGPAGNKYTVFASC